MKAAILTFSAILLLAASTVMVYAKGGINSGRPVPVIGNNPDSIVFLAKRVKKDYGGDEEDWTLFATNLARTLSQLTAAEQAELWYGPQ